MFAGPRLVLVIALALVLAGCGTNLTLWTPVQDGGDLGAERVVHHDGVEVRVQQFGVLDGWGKPTAEITVYNGGSQPVAFDLAEFKLDVDGELLSPTLEEGETSRVTVAPDREFSTQLVYTTTLPIEPRDGYRSDDMQVLTQALHLHLAPLVIDGVENPLPVLTYRNPDP